MAIGVSMEAAQANRPPTRVDSRQAAQVICTLGMHRSGTSVVSRILNLLGVYLGPHDKVSGKGTDNPRGYWEHHPLALLNDEILARFGGRWDEAPVFPSSWWRDPGLEDLRERARRLLAEDFSAEALWGWKDPRTCLTIPFWQDLVDPVRYVVCVRNPCAVVASLGRRNDMSATQAERLWLTHVRSSLAHTSGRSRMFIFYEDIMADWQPQLRRLAAFIGRPQRAEDPCVHRLVGEFLSEEMCHHRPSLEDLGVDDQVSFASKSLYLALREHAPTDTSIEMCEQPRARRVVQTTLNMLALEAIEFDRTAALVCERDRLVRDNHEQAAVLAALGTERDRLAAERQRLEAARHRLAAEVSAGARTTGALRREHDAALNELREIHTSCAWRLVAFSRRVLVAVLPAGTTRRAVYDMLLRHASRRVPASRAPRPVDAPIG